jgi:hypothetical protein
MKGMTLLGIWQEGRLMLPQQDLFRGWTPFSGSFPKSGMTAAGECWTAATSESPRGGGGYSACSLASVLETQADYLGRHPGSTPADWREYLSGYFLSARACAGILSRAGRRGRTLPPLLDRALRRVAASGRGAAREGDDYIDLDEGRVSHSLRPAGCDASEDGTGRGTPLVPMLAPAITTMYGESSGRDMEVDGALIPMRAAAFDERNVTSGANRTRCDFDEPANTLHTAGLSVVIEAEAYQCHGSNVGPMGTLRAGNGNEAGGVPFTVHSANSCARQRHAFETDTAKSLDTTGGFASGQGGSVVVEGFQANGAASERSGPVSLAASDDNGTNQVIVESAAFVALGTGHHNYRDAQGAAGCRRTEATGGTLETLITEPAAAVFAELGESHATYQPVDEAATIKPSTGGGSLLANLCVEPIPIDMRQASRGATMTNNRREGSSGGAPGIGVGQPGDPSPTVLQSHTPAIAFHLTQDPISGDPTPCSGTGSQSGGAMMGVLAFNATGGSRSVDCGPLSPPIRVGSGVGIPSPPAIVAFTCKDDGRDAGEVSLTLRAMSHDKSHANGGGQVAVVAFAQNQRDEVRDLGGVAGALAAEPGMKQQTYVCSFQERGRESGRTSRDVLPDEAYALLAPGKGSRAQERNIMDGDLIVRRLTPVECLRLQSMPSDWLDDLGLSDTAKYHMIGNGGVSNCLEWLGSRLADAIGNLEATS